MASSFDISHIIDYLKQMGIKIAHVDYERSTLELAFHGDHGQWRMIIGVQQKADASKLMLIVPHFSSVTPKKRLECLEALLAVNYRIAIGKFGLDLEDGEVRLEETFPLANNTITFRQFQLAFSAIIQTVAIYHSLLPRIIYGNVSVQEALHACEQEFFHTARHQESTMAEKLHDRLQEDAPLAGSGTSEHSEREELDINDVLAEVTRMLEERKE